MKAWPTTGPTSSATGPVATADLHFRGRRSSRILLYALMVLLAFGGCAGLRSQPRYRPPDPGRPAQSPRPDKTQERERAKAREKEKARAEKEARKARRKDGSKGGGLPTIRLFSRSSDLVEAAEEYLGVNYRYGGDTRRGMDCSGLVWRAVQDAWDRELPRSSVEMARLGMPVSRPELEPGDLLFFYTGSRGRISHVGIYKGQGRFVHASTTKGVEVADLDEGYWRRRLVCAKRLNRDSLSP